MILALVGLWMLLQATSSSDVNLEYTSVINHLKRVSKNDVIPIPKNESGPVNVIIKVSLVNIIDVDIKREEVEVLIWLVLMWENKALAWDLKEEKLNHTEVTVPANYLWTPDIVTVNNIKRQKDLSPNLAVVYNTGFVCWIRILPIRVGCDLSNLNFEGAECTLKFRSWTYFVNLLTISLDSTIDRYDYVQNLKYELVNIAHTNYIFSLQYYPRIPCSGFNTNFTIKSTYRGLFSPYAHKR